jgi:hypothetical protein
VEYIDLGEVCEECLTLPEHENAIIGIVSQNSDQHVLYHIPTILENLVNDGLTLEESLEHFQYNIKGSCQGDGYPMFLDVQLSPINSGGTYKFLVREWGII